MSNIISQSSNTFCDLDPIPTSLLKQCLSALLPTLTTMINISLSTGVFPDQFKACSVIPLLKNTILTERICPTIGLSLIYHFCRNSPSVLSKTVSLNTSQAIICSTSFNLPTPSTIQRSLRFSLFMITS